MKKLFYLGLAIMISFTSCSSDDDDVYYKNPASVGATLELKGGEGGASAINSVYVDFSAEAQLSVERASWHLGFHCQSKFAVILNNTLGSRAIEANEGVTVASSISQNDRDTYVASLSLGMGAGTFDIVDAIDDTSLSETVIQEGKVYIYDSGDAGLELYKISVAKKDANTYTLTYALWNSTEVKTLDISKNADYYFVGVSLVSNKTVNIQPTKNEWDIVWGRTTYTSAMSPGVPFVIADVVFLNTRSGVQAAEIFTADMAYADYNDTKISTTAFSSDIDVIGSGWRNGGGPSAGPSVKEDRFYAIKDTEGNVYKIRFISMSGDDGGKRGYPEVEYALVKAK